MDIQHSENEKYQALIRLYQLNGKLTPELVVEEAGHEDSPLHDAFIWDDGEAARRFRNMQANQLIELYKVTIHKPDSKSVRVRAFVHEPGRDSYAPVEEVVNDADRRAAMVERLKNRYMNMATQAAEFDEFADVVAATRALAP